MARRRSSSGFPRIALPSANRHLLAVGAAAVLAAGVAGAQALGQITQGRNPGLTLKVDPASPMALASQADRRLLANPGDRATMRASRRMAMAALEGQLYNPRALRVLGFAVQAEGQPVQARRLMQLSDRMSRRDVATQLWLIEDNVQAARLDQVLVHYDTALRATPEAGNILYPILDAAAGDPDIQRAMAPYLKAKAPWVVPFVRYAIESGQNQGAVSQLLVRYGQVPATSLQSQLLAALVTGGRYREAAAYFRSMPGARPAAASSVAFDAANVDPRFAPITWQPAVGGSASVGLETGGASGRRFRVSMPPQENATPLVKVLFLQPGRYRLSVRQGMLDGGADARVGWRADCLAAPAAPRKLLELGGDAGKAGAGAGEFTVPAGCFAQQVTLTVASGQADTGLDLAIDGLTLQRLGS